MKCHSCQWFEGGLTFGACHRYPATVNKHGNDWCGEYAEKVAVINQPVDVEITPKKRGRPSKAKHDQTSS